MENKAELLIIFYTIFLNVLIFYYALMEFLTTADITALVVALLFFCLIIYAGSKTYEKLKG